MQIHFLIIADFGLGQREDRERGGLQGRHREDTRLQDQAGAGELGECAE